MLELGQLIAGPFAGKTLSDLGADTIKIEPPGAGDPLRKWRLLHDGTSVWWEVQSRNKRSVAIDLRQPEGQDIVRRLIRQADVLIENFRPGTMEGWGLGLRRAVGDQPGPRDAAHLRLRADGPLQGPARLRRRRRSHGRAAPPDRRTGPGDRSGWASASAIRSPRFTAPSAYWRRCANATATAAAGRSSTWRLYEAVFNCMESLLPEYSAFGAVREAAGSSLARHRARATPTRAATAGS